MHKQEQGKLNNCCFEVSWSLSCFPMGMFWTNLVYWNRAKIQFSDYHFFSKFHLFRKCALCKSKFFQIFIRFILNLMLKFSFIHNKCVQISDISECVFASYNNFVKWTNRWASQESFFLKLECSIHVSSTPPL